MMSMTSPSNWLESRTIIWLVVGFFFSFVAWASYFEIDQISRSVGRVIPVGRVQVVQSVDGGIIEKIFVREGDQVRRGQVLVMLDRARLVAAVEESSAQVASLKAAMSRIQAELFDTPLEFPLDLEPFQIFVKNQRLLYAKRRDAHFGAIAALTRMLDLLREDYQLSRLLFDRGDVGRADLLRTEMSIAEVEGQIANKKNQYLEELQAEYTKIEDQLVVATQNLAQRSDALSRATLVAPSDGVVKEVRLTTVGGVLRPSDEVLQIVPTDDEFVIEAKLLPADIAQLRLGFEALIDFDAYDSSIYGSASGTVVYISPDTIREQSLGGEEAFYRVHIRFSVLSMRQIGKNWVEIQPGMTGTVRIITGQNTVMGFLLKPIIKTIRQSFGEI